MIIHDSRDTFYRTPFGAVGNGTTVILRLKFTDDELPVQCRCNVWREGYELELDMSYSPETSSFDCHFNAVSDGPPLLYYFVFIYENGDMLFYGSRETGLGGTGRTYKSKPASYQITVHNGLFKTPDWWKEGPVYHIFVDRFYSSPNYTNPRPDPGSYHHDSWDAEPLYLPHGDREEYYPDDIYGGNLQGIIEKLGYISNLGIKTIYLSPIFESHSNHKYDTADYSHIDSDFGNNAAFKLLCKKAAELNMNVVLDGVFSHTGDDSIYFNKFSRYDSLGAYQSKESPYYNWYTFSEFPDKYDCWWDFETMPTVNKSNSGFRKFINGENGIIRKWIRDGASGWRLDVADELPMEFLRELRTSAKSEKRDALIIGEVWEDASNKVAHGSIRNYCYGDTLDSVMNYPVRNAILNFMTEDITAYDAADILISLLENYPEEFTFASMNLLGSHDRPRMRTVLSGAPDHETLTRKEQAEYVHDEKGFMLSADRVRCSSALLFTLPGVPYIYYGDETGMTGMTDPFNRRTYPWGSEDRDLIDFFSMLGKLRNGNKVLIKGRTKYLPLHLDVLCCIREYRKDYVITIVNRNHTHSRTVEINLPGNYNITRLELPPLSYKILKSENTT